MRKIWVVLLAAVAFFLGGFAAMTRLAARDAITGMRITCELLDRAEASRFLTRQQRGEIVERVQQRMQRSSPQSSDAGRRVIEDFKNGCPKLTGM